MKLNKKLVTTVALVLGGLVVLNWLLNHLETVGVVLATVWGLVFPFVLGLILAFLLNLPMRAAERWYFKIHHAKLRRVLSFVTALLMVLMVLALVSTLVIPQLIDTVTVLVTNMPDYIQRIQQNLQPWIDRIPELQSFLQTLNLDWQKMGQTLFSLLSSGAGNLFTSTVGVATSILSGATSFVIGIIFACYVLFDKEHLQAQVKGLLQAYMPARKYRKLMDVATLSNRTFSRFVSGQCLEAVAVSLMFLLVLSIGQFDYALLISVLIGFFSIIPIFGAFIACFVGAFLILVSSGLWRMLAFIIVFLVVQQIDGNVTYPRIVGTTVGLPALWVLVAVTVGGGLMGIFGMLFFIPLASVLYTLLRRDALRRLEDKGITPPTDGLAKPPPKRKSKVWEALKAKVRGMRTRGETAGRGEDGAREVGEELPKGPGEGEALIGDSVGDVGAGLPTGGNAGGVTAAKPPTSDSASGADSAGG